MDANNTRYHALITQDDWTRATEPQALAWSAKARGLALRAQLFEFKATRSTLAPNEEPGRGGVFDAHGNLYALSPDRLSILVRSAGSGIITTFWPAGTAAQEGVGAIEGLHTGREAAVGNTHDGGFHAAAPSAMPAATRLDALTVTAQHYLVAASREAAGLLVFDLHGAGPPLFQPWPGLGAVVALVALEDGGIGALVGNTVTRLGAALKPWVPRLDVSTPFCPLIATPEEATRPAPAPAVDPCFIDLSASLPGLGEATTLAVDADRLIVFGKPGAGPDGDVWLGAMGLNGRAINILTAQTTSALTPAPTTTVRLNALIGLLTVDGTTPRLACRSIAVCKLEGQAAGVSIFVVAAAGDQAFRFTAVLEASGLRIDLQREFWPLRRYEALGLATLPAGLRLHAYPLARVFYASEERWAPLLELARPRYELSGVLQTPVWDSGVDGCVWHRLLLDMRLPSGTHVRVETRGCDGPAAETIEQQPWSTEPNLIRSARGREQPWQEPAGAAAEQGSGTWEILLQNARRRWFQARLVIAGDGQRSPVLRALRVWYPRFSYARTYLPPVYAQDPSSAEFLDRYLALFEGEFTRWEDRIASAQLLFDARTAPAATLEWLAMWLGLAFDAADSDPSRRRLLIRYAVRGYARRGTVPGLLLAATLAWEPSIEEAWLRDPTLLLRRPHGIRLQEFFSRLRALPADAWRPAQGRAALLTRLSDDPALTLPESAAAASERGSVLIAALGFMPRAAEEEGRLWAAWQTWANTEEPLPTDEFTDAAARTDWTAYLQGSRACAALRQRWQDFLSRRFRRISTLNADWGTHWTAFERVPAPTRLPGSDAALAIWHHFEAQVLRAEPHAHRFRVVLPLPRGTLDLDDIGRRRSSVLRVVERDKPAHSIAEVRFAIDLFRIGEARLGLDTQLEEGLGRRPELVALSRALLGRTELGAARLTPTRPRAPSDRMGLDRGEPLDR